MKLRIQRHAWQINDHWEDQRQEVGEQSRKTVNTDSRGDIVGGYNSGALPPVH
jgi:hypothetical protein